MTEPSISDLKEICPDLINTALARFKATSYEEEVSVLIDTLVKIKREINSSKNHFQKLTDEDTITALIVKLLKAHGFSAHDDSCLLYTSPSQRDATL